MTDVEKSADVSSVGSDDLLGGIAEKHEEMMCWRTATFCGTPENKIDLMRMAIDELCDHADELMRIASELTRQRIGWKCNAGGEEFTTHDESVADEWKRDGFDVEKFVIASHMPPNG